MKRFVNLFAVVAVFCFVVLGTADLANAQRRNERQVRDLVRSLNAQIDDFQYGLDHQLRSSSTRNQDVENIHDRIRNLQTTVDDFEENLNSRRENRDDVRAIVTAAKEVDTDIAQLLQNRRIESNWQGVRTTINNLASNYGVTPDWNTGSSSYPTTTPRDPSDYPTTTPRDPSDHPTTPRDRRGAVTPARNSAPTSALTGTYQLDATRSENTNDI